MRTRLPWALLATLVAAQICYPLTDGRTRATLTVTTVLLGYAMSVTHAFLTRGPRAATALIATATVGGFAVEAVGVATGFPFGTYDYSGELGPKLLGVPLIIPLAWTWMAWPAWLAAIHLTQDRKIRIAAAVAGLAAWDVFLDPQMVAEGYWRWHSPTPALPGVPGIPLGNYAGWLGFALLLMLALSAAGGPACQTPTPGDAPIVTLWCWTYASSVLAHAVFLFLPASAAWGAALMGTAVLPLAAHLVKAHLVKARRSAPAMVLADVSPAGPPAMTTKTGIVRPPAHSDLRPPASSAGGWEPGPHQGSRPGRGRLS